MARATEEGLALFDVIVAHEFINPFPLNINATVLTVTAHQFFDGVFRSADDVIAVIFYDVRPATFGAFQFISHSNQTPFLDFKIDITCMRIHRDFAGFSGIPRFRLFIPKDDFYILRHGFQLFD
jgi:hypothetical protein